MLRKRLLVRAVFLGILLPHGVVSRAVVRSRLERWVDTLALSWTVTHSRVVTFRTMIRERA